ncbi:MAG: ChbG/HpnK family deacetylase [Terriglobia bacterium]
MAAKAIYIEEQVLGGPGSGASTGALIVNADDWGRDRETTERTLECIRRGAVSSVSAMVFMQDSERAAGVAREHGIDAGLHLNLTERFSTSPSRLAEYQRRIARRLHRHRLAQVIFDPLLMNSFEYAVAAQIEEFSRLYGAPPRRIDGHHHMHLCANVLLGKLLPRGVVVRRNFSIGPGEKNLGNRLYRRAVDLMLSRRHALTDFFFALEPLEPRERLRRIFSLARRFTVEVETHPANPDEYQFLSSGEVFRWAADCRVARGYSPPTTKQFLLRPARNAERAVKAH